MFSDSDLFQNHPPEHRVLIVDSHLSIAQMMAVYLLCEHHCKVVGTVATAKEALQTFEASHPTMVIAELEISDQPGPEMLREMRTQNPNVQILIYTGTTKAALLKVGLEMEPRGFVHKLEGTKILNQAISLVAQGTVYRSPYATALLDRKRAEENGAARLTNQERALVRSIARGKSTKQIADELCLSPKTVENYRKQIMSKLGINGIANLTQYALHHGMLD